MMVIRPYWQRDVLGWYAIRASRTIVILRRRLAQPPCVETRSMGFPQTGHMSLALNVVFGNYVGYKVEKRSNGIRAS